MSTSIENITLKRKARSISTFLKKTYDLLNDSDSIQCVKWAPNGIGFVVTNQQIFSKVILPKYFKHSNYSSFVRQLNMYNFHKIRQNNNESYFHHECFDKDNRSAMSQIRRKPEKKKRKNIQDEQQNGDNDNENSNDSIPLKHKQSMKTQMNSQKKRTNNNSSQEKISINLIMKEQQENMVPPELKNNLNKQKGSKSQPKSKNLFGDRLLNLQNGVDHQNLFVGNMDQPCMQNQPPAINLSQHNKYTNNGSNYICCQDQQCQNQYCQNYSLNHNTNGRQSDRHLLSISSYDNISINDDINDKMPFVTAKELFYPSAHNLFPFMSQGYNNSINNANTFSIFY